MQHFDIPRFILGFIFFVGSSLLAYYFIISPLILVNRAKDWVKTPAQILDIRLDSHREIGYATHRLDISYQYEFNGFIHTSKRFCAFGGSDSSDFNPKNYHHYKRFHDAQQPITCYVDPRNPDQAIIDRASRFWQFKIFNLFALFFSIAGLCMMFASFYQWRGSDEP